MMTQTALERIVVNWLGGNHLKIGNHSCTNWVTWELSCGTDLKPISIFLGGGPYGKGK